MIINRVLNIRISAAVWLLALLTLPGCLITSNTVPSDLAHIRANDSLGGISAGALPAYAERRSAEFASGSATFFLLRLEPAAWRWRLGEDSEHSKTAATWREQLGATIAINAAYFTASGTPSGYFRASPSARSSVPWPKDSGGYTGAVAIKDGELTLHYRREKKIDSKNYDAIFLTYPMLLTAGRPLVVKESGLLARRTVLAEDNDGTDYIIVTEEGGATLYELSRWLSAQPEHFVRAVNLDGGPSTGLSLADGENRLEVPSAPIPNILFLTRD